MKYLLMWGITVIVSFVMEVSNELRYFKDIADNGYKVNLSKLSELQKQLNAQKPSLTKFLIPIYNMMLAMQNTMQYSNNRDMFFTGLNVLGCLEEMSEYEKREYGKKPTSLNALLVPLKADLKLQRALKITVKGENGQEDSIIYLEIGTNEDIAILKIIGPVSKLSNEEQLDIVYNELEILVQGVKEFGGFDKVIEQIKNNNGIVDISTKKYKDDSNIQEKNITSSTVDKFENTSEQQSDLGFSKMQADIAELEELKQELLNASSNKKEKTYQKK